MEDLLRNLELFTKQTQSTSGVVSEKVKKLMDMGFHELQAKAALAKSVC